MRSHRSDQSDYYFRIRKGRLDTRSGILYCIRVWKSSSCTPKHKLHLICSEKGEFLNYMLIPDNVDEREPLRNKFFIWQVLDKLVGDKEYIRKDIFSRLFVDGIQLITKLKSNMKGQLMTVPDKIFLRRRT